MGILSAKGGFAECVSQWIFYETKKVKEAGEIEDKEEVVIQSLNEQENLTLGRAEEKEMN